MGLLMGKIDKTSLSSIVHMKKQPRSGRTGETSRESMRMSCAVGCMHFMTVRILELGTGLRKKSGIFAMATWGGSGVVAGVGGVMYEGCESGD